MTEPSKLQIKIRKVQIIVSPEERFRLWYLEPLEELKKMNGGSGQAAFAALMIAMPLYERVIQFKYQDAYEKRKLYSYVKDDLGFDTEDDADIFWNAFRDGLCHTGSFFAKSGKAKRKGWIMPTIKLDAKCPKLPKFLKYKNAEGKEMSVIFVDPWSFIGHILAKYEKNVPLLEFALAPLIPLYRTYLEVSQKVV